MRQLFIAILSCTFSFSVVAQGVTLTKGETVTYLDKKIKEIDGQSTQSNPLLSSGTQYFWANNYRVFLSNDNVYIEYEFSNYPKNSERKDVEERQLNEASGNTYVRQRVTQYPCNYYATKVTYKLNPAHILSIVKYEGSGNAGSIGFIKINLTSAVATRKFETTTPQSSFKNFNYENNDKVCYNLKSSAQEVGGIKVIDLPFLNSDPGNFEKIKKALEYLSKLLKAEDDPFGN